MFYPQWVQFGMQNAYIFTESIRPALCRIGQSKTRWFARRSTMTTHSEAFAEPVDKRLKDRNLLREESRDTRFDLKAGISNDRTEAAAPENADQYSPPMQTDKNAKTIPAKRQQHQSVRRRVPSPCAADDKCSRLNCASGVWRYAAGYWFL